MAKFRADSQSRKWQITINNPNEINLTIDALESILESVTYDYYCFCQEVADTGTPHMHVFVYSENQKRFSTIKNMFPTGHIEKAVGSCKENHDYIAKSGKWENDHKAHTKVEGSFREKGKMPTECSEKNIDLALLIEKMKSGVSNAELLSEFPQYALKVKNLNDLRMTLISDGGVHGTRDVRITFYYGDESEDKIGFVYSECAYKDVCRITNYGGNKGISFDTYRGQKVIVFENFAGQIPLEEMLVYVGKYPVTLPARYEDRIACYVEIYLLSNFPISELYSIEKKQNAKLWDKFEKSIDRFVYLDENGVYQIKDKKGNVINA